MILKSVVLTSLVFGATGLVPGPAPSPQDRPGEAAPQRSTEKFAIDGVHSSVVFRVQHLQAAWFFGRFNQVSGEFKVDDARLDDSWIKVEIPAESVDSGNESRDRHLKSQDFFSVKEFPKISFASSKVEKAGDGYKVTGDLTLRGVTKSITVRAQHVGTANVSPRSGLRSGYLAEFTIKRSDFGMSYGLDNGALGDEVHLTVSLEGMLPKDGRDR